MRIAPFLALAFVGNALAAEIGDPTLDTLRLTPSFPEALSSAYDSFSNPFLVSAPEQAEDFKRKAREAAAGVAVPPQDPATLGIADEALAAELQAGHAGLNQVLDGGARVYLPPSAANAQVKFDCWAVATSLGAEGAAGVCSRQFLSEIDRIRGTLGIRPDPRMRGVVLFDFGSAALNEWSKPVLDAIAASLAAERPEAIVAVGRADTVGRAETNEALSKQRAIVVEQALEVRGLDPDVVRFEVLPLGDTSPVVETGDNVRLVYNRQVAIWAGTNSEVDAALMAE